MLRTNRDIQLTKRNRNQLKQFVPPLLFLSKKPKFPLLRTPEKTEKTLDALEPLLPLI